MEVNSAESGQALVAMDNPAHLAAACSVVVQPEEEESFAVSWPADCGWSDEECLVLGCAVVSCDVRQDPDGVIPGYSLQLFKPVLPEVRSGARRGP